MDEEAMALRRELVLTETLEHVRMWNKRWENMSAEKLPKSVIDAELRLMVDNLKHLSAKIGAW